MKIVHLSQNLILIRAIWRMNRMQLGQLVDCSEHQIGGYERGVNTIPPQVIFGLEDLTGIAAKRLFYEQLTNASIPNRPLSPTESVEKAPPQYLVENLTLEERVKRLEMKVFGI
jgi:hypothetical protein